jgi:uncharacterized membrane protein
MRNHHHSHSYSHSVAVSDRGRRIVTGVAVALAVLTALGVVLLRSGHDTRAQAAELGLDSARYKATVHETVTQPCSYAGDDASQRCMLVTVRPRQGPDAGMLIELGEYNLDDPFVPDLSEGARIVVGYEETNGTYFYADRERRQPLALLFLVFAGAVIALGRLRGLAALLALGVTVVVLLQFIVPAVLGGRNPLFVALVGSALIAYLALYLAHGINPMTTVALLGALGALALTAVLAWTFFELTAFSGAVSEEATYLPLLGGNIDVRGLLLGGVVIGALGALDDVTITQSSAVFELRAADPAMSGRNLYRSAMRIGREHVGSTVNTLLLAYAGASMPLLLLFVVSAQSLGTVANSEVVAVEIVRTLVGSIGLVASVPLTTGLAAWLVTDKAPARSPERRQDL